jgi:small subunit ribosomal protein S16
MGRTHRPFYRVCAMDARAPRDGRVIEELGHYDPMVPETDARAILNAERIDYWLNVGAQPSDKVKVLIRKYGSQGTHREQQRQALEKLKQRPQAPPPQPVARKASAAAAVGAEAEPAGEAANE